MTFHLRGLIVFALFVAALGVALFTRWGIIAAGCIILIDWVWVLFAGGWGRSGFPKPASRSSSH